MTTPGRLTRAEAALRRHALAYPETHEDFPWGHRAIKVKGKVFLFMAMDGNVFNLSVKLPVSGAMALDLPFVSPTGYGLGKSGWVTARFGAEDEVPVDMLQEWVDESFRAIAPKKVLAKLENAEADSQQGHRDKLPAPEPRRRKKRPSQ
jgi:predicted DNA-binding protein (MmcQ/YjbR family)